MTNTKIFSKIVEKAYANDPNDFLSQVCDFTPLYKIQYNEHYSIIFSHDFAKAFWGEYCGKCDEGRITVKKGGYGAEIELSCFICGHEPFWCINLQKMVLEKNPLKYLEKFL